jgi:hypothetical protein
MEDEILGDPPPLVADSDYSDSESDSDTFQPCRVQNSKEKLTTRFSTGSTGSTRSTSEKGETNDKCSCRGIAGTCIDQVDN